MVRGRGRSIRELPCSFMFLQIKDKLSRVESRLMAGVAGVAVRTSGTKCKLQSNHIYVRDLMSISWNIKMWDTPLRVSATL